MMKAKAVFSLALVALLAGCSAIKATPQAATVRLVDTKPEGECVYLGEAIGSQGNFISGNFTRSSDLMAGARNDLRNKALAMGGNQVYVQNISNSQADESLGTTNTLVVGDVYHCG